MQHPSILEIRRAIFGGGITWGDHEFDEETKTIMTSTATWRGMELVRVVDKTTKISTYRAAPTKTNDWADFEVATPEGTWIDEDGPFAADPNAETLRLRRDAEDRELEELREDNAELRRRLDAAEARITGAATVDQLSELRARVIKLEGGGG